MPDRKHEEIVGQLKEIKNAARGTSISNRTEWTVLVPILIVMIFTLIGFLFWIGGLTK